MMNRRRFLQLSSLVAAGAIAADQLELLDRLAPRSLFAAWPTPPKLWGDGIHDDTAALRAMIQLGLDTNSRLVVIPRGTYRLTRTIELHGRRGPDRIVDMQGSWIRGDVDVSPLVLIHPMKKPLVALPGTQV